MSQPVTTKEILTASPISTILGFISLTLGPVRPPAIHYDHTTFPISTAGMCPDQDREAQLFFLPKNCHLVELNPTSQYLVSLGIPPPRRTHFSFFFRPLGTASSFP